MSFEAINEGNQIEAQGALCRITDELVQLSNALFGYANGTSKHVDRVEAIRALLCDSQTEEMLVLAQDVVNHWKSYLEIRTHPSDVYAVFLFAETFRQQKNIEVPLEFSEIQRLHELAIAECEGPYSEEQEIEIRAKVVARWLGIDEG